MATSVPLETLVPDPHNRRSHPARNLEMITAALREVGAGRSLVIDENNEVLAGNGVLAAAPAAGLRAVRIVEIAGDELLAVRRRGLTDEQKRALAIYDNRTGELAEWNAEQLKLDAAAGLPLEAWFSAEELARVWGGLPSGGAGAASLVERFGVPPFSVLDARQGYWQDRKRAWLSLGIQSELGRGENLQSLSEQAEDYRASEGAYKKRPAAATPDGTQASALLEHKQRDARLTPGGRGKNSAWRDSNPKKRKPNATPSGAPMPAANYSKNKARGDGRGRPITRRN